MKLLATFQIFLLSFVDRNSKVFEYNNREVFFHDKYISRQDMMMVDIDMLVLSPCIFHMAICMSENKVYVLNDRTNV